jgi:hypothetical protein
VFLYAIITAEVVICRIRQDFLMYFFLCSSLIFFVRTASCIFFTVVAILSSIKSFFISISSFFLCYWFIGVAIALS